MSKNNTYSILNITRDDLIDTSLFINWNDEEREKIFKMLNEDYTIKELAKILNHEITTLYEIRIGKVKPSTKLYFSFLNLLKNDVDISSLIISSRNAYPIKIKKCVISPELIGLIHSDGHLNLIKSGKVLMFGFYNQQKKLIDRFCELILDTFECDIHIRKDARDGTYYACPPSVVGRIIAKKIEYKTKNYQNLDFLEEDIPSYITGLFDGDGTIYVYRNSRITIPTIKITTDSSFHAEHIRYLLSKVGIYSRICHETIKNWKWCNIVITRQKDFLRFIRIVDSKHSIKKLKIEKYLNNKSPNLSF